MRVEMRFMLCTLAAAPLLLAGGIGQAADTAQEEFQKREHVQMVDERRDEAGPRESGESKASAKAEASASASSSASSKSSWDATGKCEARAESSAQATADGKTRRQHDEDYAADEADGCKAESRSSATATTGDD